MVAGETREGKMKFGLFYLPTHVPEARDVTTHLDDIVEQVLFADAIGIEYVWMVEHHFVRHGGLCAGNFPFLAYLAGRTKQIRFGTGATVLPLNDPVRVAEMAATLDQLSKGRFDFGIGRGFLRDEFDAFGVDMSETRARVEDGVELVKRAWTEPTLAYNGKFRPRIDGLTILPPIFQKPHPPIWVACFLTQESFVWTAAEGYNLLYVAYHVDSKTAGERVHWYLDALPRFGRSAAGHDVCCCYHAHFTANDDVARLRSLVEKPMAEYTAAGVEAARRPPDPVAYKGYAAREDYQRQATFETYFPDRVLMGAPGPVLERIAYLRSLGMTQLALIVDFGSLRQADIMRSLEVFARDILPQARAL
jgi:alkanesulfonate monooxygenase SsuD/methylene tetrahydromethanopterin reductase-like flavin-dependent oxidoreductase (luciferase family)